MNGITSARLVSAAVVKPIDLWWVAIASTLIPTSLIWDFSWESSIGVDRFWSPPHLATHIGVWLGGLLGLRLIFNFTLSRAHGHPTAGVGIGRLCGPSGAWILLWGAAILQAALPFDNWWQKAYGLGAGLWHPPQILKAIGFFTLLFGGTILCATARSDETRALQTPTNLLTWHGGLLLTMSALVLTMTNYPNFQHTASFYMISCAVYPIVLLTVGWAAQLRWGATWAALACMVVVCVMVWALPLFPARPLTAPIHNPTDHMMPPAFPLLLVVPAAVLDWLHRRLSCRGGFFGTKTKGMLLAVACGLGFVAAFVPVQWLFSEFLLSSLSDNWFFAGGGRHWPFFLKIDKARVMFWNLDQDPLTRRAMFMAMVFAILSAWIGLGVGTWLRKLRR